MDNYTLKPRGIKNILRAEIEAHFNNLDNIARKSYVPNVQEQMIDNSRDEYIRRLESCNDYESLEAFVEWAGYRMSLSEWIASL